MFTIKRDEAKVTVQDLINGVTSQMDTYDAFAQEYITMMEQLQTLHKMRMTEKDRSRPSADAILGLVANLAGIATIVNFEQTHALTSKAVAFLGKLK